MYNWNNKKLLLLGATNLMGLVCQEAQKHGAFVIATDYYENSPAKKIADKSYMISTTDVDNIVELIHKEHIDGIITGYMDSMLPYYKQICERTNLPCYLTDKSLEFATDKQTFKRLCKKYEIPVVKEYTDIKNVEYPVIVKPVDNSGARGITICKNESELNSGIETALENSKRKEILIEQYLDYKEATVFYVFINGKAYLSLIGDRHIAPVREGFIKLPTGYTFPSEYTDNFIKTLHPKFVQMFQDLGIKNGVMFIQSFIDNKGNFIPYEPGFRLTASLEYEILKKACGYNPFDMMINFALTGKMTDNFVDNNINPLLDKKYYNISCLIKPGKIKTFQGVEEIKNLPNVLTVFQSYAEGDVLDEKLWGKLAQIALRIIFYADSQHKYDETIGKIKKYLKIISDNNENMLINTEIIRG